MGLFDFFKPKWKHSNPIIRKQAVESIKDDNVLMEIAGTDNETGVCKAALKKLSEEAKSRDAEYDR